VATAFLALLLRDAGTLARPGFQLSFCGVLGLVLLAGPLEARLRRWLPGDWLRSFRSAVAAGAAATLLTLPVVAWHFDQVSVVGVPATLVSTPLVAAAIPGAFASLVADALHPALGAFLAGGTDLLLWLLLGATEGLAGLPFSVAWVPRAWIFAGAAGAAVALALLSGSRRMSHGVRGLVALAGTTVAVLLLPLAERAASRGTVELLFLDVGQGDAILVRSPGARWILVDAGPPGGFGGGSDPPVLEALRRLGIRSLEAVFLTHPHLDHIGGAPPVLRAMPVGAMVDPGLALGTDTFVQVLETAAERANGWRAAREGDRFLLDGLDLRVLNSLEDDRPGGGGGDEVNENSLVVHLSFGAFSALLTGDAPVLVEEAAIRDSGPVDLLKVGHHGSRTSTSSAFLDEARPGAAVISAGRGNRYGHPHEPVLARLVEAGAQIFRTDRDGTVRVVARRDGSFSVTVERGR
jgi:competence protein ComEC